MNHELICEDFEITDAIRSHIEKLTNKLQESCEIDMTFHFYLSRSGKGEYRTGIKTHVYDRDLYAQSDDRDLYEAATSAKRALRKQIIELNKQKHEHH